MHNIFGERQYYAAHMNTLTASLAEPRLLGRGEGLGTEEVGQDHVNCPKFQLARNGM